MMSPINNINTLRFSGMASGIDTEEMVRNLMRVENMNVDRIKQDRQLLEWKRDAYRDVSNLIRGMKDEFFDILKPKSYMLSANMYKTFEAASSNTDVVTVSTNSSALAGKYSISSVKVATTAKVDNKDNKDIVKSSVDGTPVDFGTVPENPLSLAGKSFTITVNGVSKTISFTDQDDAQLDSQVDTESKMEELTKLIQTKLDDAFGTSVVTVSDKSGALSFKAAGDIKLTSAPSDTNALGDLGFFSGQGNKMNLDYTLKQFSAISETPLVFIPKDDGTNIIKIEINEKVFEFSDNMSLRQVMSTINNDTKAGVTMSYSELSGMFTIQTKATGLQAKLDMKDISGTVIKSDGEGGNTTTTYNTNFLTAIGIGNKTGDDAIKGTDAKVTINGVPLTRANNSFTIDGISFNFKEDFTASVENKIDPIVVNVKLDINTAFENIKSFVDKYNSLIDTFNGKLREEKFTSFKPLTDEQRQDMKEKEIEQWEEKAKSGMLKSDTIVQNILTSLRRVLIEPIEGMPGVTLSSIGITTGAWYENGKLNIDETKLKEALTNRGDEVIALFTKQSDISYSPDLSNEDRSQRTKESGLMHRVSDIFQDYIRTTRNKDGKKGILLEKAGIKGDLTDTQNLMNDELKRMDDRIDNMLRILTGREEMYWRRFTAMEKAIQQMNSQSAWLSQQLGGMG